MTPSWSKSLREQTLLALHELPPLPDGLLHMKHLSDGAGYFRILDLVSGKYALYQRGQETRISFETPEAVIDAGWAID